jgi:hypothetical protein
MNEPFEQAAFAVFPNNATTERARQARRLPSSSPERLRAP